VATEIPKASLPLRVRDLIYFFVELLFIAGGLYWIIRNPKTKEASLYPKGDSQITRPGPDRGVRIALAIVLFGAVLMVYQLFFMPRPK